MHPRVERLPQPAPDAGRFLRMLRREQVERVPLIELAIDARTVNLLLDEPQPAGDVREVVTRLVRLQHRLGYDVVKVSAQIPLAQPGLYSADDATSRQWQDGQHGPIQTADDCERFAWPRAADVDFGPIEAAIAALPDGMKLIGFAGGVLEYATYMMGLEPFLRATRREPELAGAVVDRVGATIYGVFEAYCQMDAVVAVWLGDDLGHKHGPLLSPKWMARHLVPWYERLAAVAHSHGRPFLLHSCGDTSTIMPQIIERAGIDAKHSYEDGIQRVEDFYDRWHERIAVLGGVDMHLLASGSEDDVRRRTRDILDHVASGGGYALGSGNSIPDYIPPANYLAMLETAAAFNA